MSTLASVVIRDITANRPAAGVAGRLFFATDTSKTWRDNGTSWDDVSDAVAAQNDVTASRAFATTYQNTGVKPIFVSVWGVSTTSTPGSFWVVCDSGATPSLITASTGYAINSENVAIFFIVLPSYYYQVKKDQSMTITKWIEWS